MFGPYQVAITSFKKKTSTFLSISWQSTKAQATSFAEVTDPAVTISARGAEGVGDTPTILHTK